MPHLCDWTVPGPAVWRDNVLSGVVPANRTEESEVRELLGKESGISSETRPLRNFVRIYKQMGVPEPVPAAANVRKPHFLRLSLPELLLTLPCPSFF